MANIGKLKKKKSILIDNIDLAKQVKTPTKRVRKARNRFIEELRNVLGRTSVRIKKAQLKKKLGSRRPTILYTRISPNKSSRSISDVDLIVLHSTESDNINGSINDLVGIANYFGNPSSQVSSHVITDADGHSARCVEDKDKSWTQGYYNSRALSIEQIGRAASERWTDAHYRETARWIARWCNLYDIPCRRGSTTSAGIVTHKDLGSAGGGHVDPGPNFDVDKVIRIAKEYMI